MADLRCSSCSSYLFNSSVQCSCGDRLCGDCYSSFKSSKKLTLNCPKCHEEISLNDCFKDKAAENELKTATIKCTNQDCPGWEGSGKFHMAPVSEGCEFKVEDIDVKGASLSSTSHPLKVTSGPMLIPKLHVECVEMRAQHNDHTQSESVEPQRILQRPAAGILGFGAIVEAAALPDY